MYCGIIQNSFNKIFCLKLSIFLFIRLLNKNESEDQAHIYIPAERKQKIEEPPRCLGFGEKATEITTNNESQNLFITKQGENEQHPMDFELDKKSIVMESVNMETNNKNSDDIIVVTKKKPILTEEDINNFKSSISYVSTI